MITLKQAIEVLSLYDSDEVFICKEHFDISATRMTIKEIKEKYNIEKTMIERIYPNHFKYSDSLDYEFIIPEN